jgi:predicted regulator of Ras-like GTPase activity (Roadblock/LC7/MglB family)
VDAARALADLVEISPQIEAAAVFDGDGAPLGSIGMAETSAGGIASGLRALLEAAAKSRSEGARVTQLHATLGGGDVFAVVDSGERAIVAVVAERTAPGLLFYDLKRCLAALDEIEAQPKPTPRRRRKKAEDEA